MTKQEQQDANYEKQGFRLDRDFENNHQELKDMVDFIIRDGGEIRQDKAYELDETTIRQGWTRLYWK